MRQITDEKYEYVMHVLDLLKETAPDDIRKSYVLDVIDELKSLPHSREQEVQGEGNRIAQLIRDHKDDYPENVLRRVVIELRNMGYDICTTKKED